MHNLQRTSWALFVFISVARMNTVALSEAPKLCALQYMFRTEQVCLVLKTGILTIEHGISEGGECVVTFETVNLFLYALWF